MTIRTSLTELFDLTYPIVLAPMAAVSGGGLASSVSNAGGLGLVGGSYGDRAKEALEQILSFHPDVVFLSFGDASPLVPPIKDSGCRRRLTPSKRRRRVRSILVLAVASLFSLVLVTPALATPGSQLWVARYDGPASKIDQARGVGLSPDGSKVFVTGTSDGSGTGEDYNTVAYNAATGDELWVQRYDGPASRYDRASALEPSPDGATVYVTGYSYGGHRTGEDYATVAYSASTGETLWVRRYDGPASRSDRAMALGVSADGSLVFVTGWSRASQTGSDYTTVAYQVVTGDRVWVRRYDGPASGTDRAHSLALGPGGSGVYVTGTSPGAGTDYDFATVAYDAATGDPLWVKRYDGPLNSRDGAHAIVMSPDGSTVYVTGHSRGSSTWYDFDYATVAYDATTGDPVWVRRYDGSGNGRDLPHAIGVSPDGSTVYVTGTSDGLSTYLDYTTVAYNGTTGQRIWVARYDDADALEYATALTVSPDGSTVFVTGFSTGPGGTLLYDYVTVALAASTGASSWVTRYDGPGAWVDQAIAIGVSPDGSAVFVTGTSNGTPTGDDYVTLSYSNS